MDTLAEFKKIRHLDKTKFVLDRAITEVQCAKRAQREVCDDDRIESSIGC